MAVKYFTEECDYKFKGKLKTSKWLRSVATMEGFDVGDLNYIFCSSERHREINRQYLSHDYFTDVITFDYTEIYETPSAKGSRGIVAGDMFIDPQTVELNAKEFMSTPAIEMQRVVVHGLLHLCGHGDKSPEEAKIMRRLEDKYLSIFLDNNE